MTTFLVVFALTSASFLEQPPPLSAFLSNGEVNERLAEGFPPSSIVKSDQFARKVTVLDFIESDVFSATCNQRAGARIIEPNVNQVEIT